MHRLAILLLTFALLLTPMLCPANAPGSAAPARAKAGGPPYWIGPAISGSWYNSARSGEGFILELLADGTALAVWFTYAPAGNNGAQAWIIAQGGLVDGDRIVFQNALTTRGPRFGAGFDPAAVQVLPWGTLEFRFESCDRGSVTYAGPAAWGSGVHQLTRLTRVHGLDCTRPPTTDSIGLRPLADLRSTSGAWFDPSHSGEGWFVEELSAQSSLVYWFSYDSRGEQAWFLGVGNRLGDTLAMDLSQPVGASFGAAFDPAAVRPLAWGDLRFVYRDCLQAAAPYHSILPGFGDGVLDARRLSVLASNPCLVETPTLATLGRWRSGARMPIAQSEVATAELAGNIYVAGGFNLQTSFQRYDPLANTWTQLRALPGGRNHALAAAFGSSVYVFGGNVSGSGDTSSTAWRYAPASDTWQTLPGLPAVVASGATVVNGRIFLGDESGNIVEFDPRSGRTRIVLSAGVVLRDHSQLVAWFGELWLLGGRAQETREQRTTSVYNLASDSWRSGPPMIVPRAGFAAAVVNDQIMVTGGEWLFNTPRVLNDFEVLAPGSSGWARGPSLPIALHGVGGVAYQGEFYVLGGSQVAGIANNTGDVQVYDP